MHYAVSQTIRVRWLSLLVTGHCRKAAWRSFTRSSARSLFATLEQPRRFHPIRPGRESRRRTAPAQRLDTLEEWRIGAQRREFLEEQRELALFTENVLREVFDRTVAVQKLGGGPGADPRDA